MVASGGIGSTIGGMCPSSRGQRESRTGGEAVGVGGIGAGRASEQAGVGGSKKAAREQRLPGRRSGCGAGSCDSESMGAAGIELASSRLRRAASWWHLAAGRQDGREQESWRRVREPVSI